MIYPNVADGIHRVEDAFTNFYVIEAEDGLTVVDAGVRSSWASLHALLRSIRRAPGDIAAVVLTHAHFDHVGFAARAHRELGVPVHLHENDAPLARHPWRYDFERLPLLYFATQPRALPIVGSFLRTRAFFPPPVRETVRLEEGTLAVPGRPVVLHTPGHTLGHCSLHLPDRDVLIAGDALVMLDPYTARTGPRLVARAATADVGRNLRSLDALAGTGATHVLTGHGEPWRQGIEAAVARARDAGSA